MAAEGQIHFIFLDIDERSQSIEVFTKRFLVLYGILLNFDV